MSETSKKFFLTFPKKIIREPIIYSIGQKFKVVTNIRAASVTDEVGLVALELTGEADEVERALQYMREKDVKIELLKED